MDNELHALDERCREILEKMYQYYLDHANMALDIEGTVTGRLRGYSAPILIGIDPAHGGDRSVGVITGALANGARIRQIIEDEINVITDRALIGYTEEFRFITCPIPIAQSWPTFDEPDPKQKRPAIRNRKRNRGGGIYDRQGRRR